MKQSSRIIESLIIFLVISLFFQLYIAKGAEDSVHNLDTNSFISDQINRPELPIGPVEGNCQNCRFIPANPIISLELLQNAGSAMTDHWFRPEFIDLLKFRGGEQYRLKCTL